MRRTIVVMASAPIPGETALSPPLDQESAARLHECFLLDTLDRASAVPDTELVVSYAPIGSLGYFREIAPCAERFTLQEGKDIGSRIHHCFEQLLEPERGVAVIGTSVPTLPARSLELAFDALASDQVDVVFGPIRGGGCYLVGAKALHPELIRAVNWAADDPQKVVELAAQLGLGWYLLPEWYGVRTPGELAFLERELRKSPSSACHTTEFLLGAVKPGI